MKNHVLLYLSCSSQVRTTKSKNSVRVYREQHNFFLTISETHPCIFSDVNINFWKFSVYFDLSRRKKMVGAGRRIRCRRYLHSPTANTPSHIFSFKYLQSFLSDPSSGALSCSNHWRTFFLLN